MVLKTPPYFFPEHSAAAVEAGCHVYVAKPVAIDVPGCLTIAELGKKSTENQKVFHVDFQWRYLPYLVECVNYIREGKMGDIRFVRAFYNDEGREDVQVKNDISELFQGLRWAMSRELGGDRIVSAGIHAIDTALIVIGSRPEKACGVVQQSRKNPINSATDTASLTYTFPGGVVMNYSGDQFRNYHSDIDMFSGVKAYADGAHMQTFYGKGMTCMRSADLALQGRRKPEPLHLGCPAQCRPVPQASVREARFHQHDGPRCRRCESDLSARRRSRSCTCRNDLGRTAGQR